MKLRSNDIPVLRWRDVAASGDAAHVARAGYGSNRLAVHRHDFAEVFWIEKGRARHRVNGERQTLLPGQVVWIRPDDEHGLSTLRGEGFVLMNVAFEVSRWQDMLQRYFKQEAASWSQQTLPPTAVLDPSQASQLSRLADQLSERVDDAAMLDALLLLGMTFSLRQSQRGRLPNWLNRAMVEADRVDIAELTVEAFVERCGKTREHVNRAMRAAMGMTTTHWLLSRKLEHAARLLRFDDAPITAVALDSGFENLGYFYQCFGKRFRMTPRQYRLRARATVE